MVGPHVIKCWSATQLGVAMSSSEAVLYGVVRAAATGPGIKVPYGDTGIGLPVRPWTDSSAAIGICNRQGLAREAAALGVHDDLHSAATSAEGS